MSRIRADRIVNRAANGPVEVSEGLKIPSDKRLTIDSSVGSPGQVLTSTETGLSWSDIPPAVSNLSDLIDVNIDSPSAGQVLRYNGYFYSNSSLSYSELSDTPTIPTNIVIENSSPTFNNLYVNEDLIVIGTTTTANVATLNVTNNKIILNDSVDEEPLINASLEIERGTFSNTEIRWNETIDRWEFTNDGSTYYNIPILSEYNDYGNLSNRPSVPQTLGDLLDVFVSSAQENQILRWNGLTWSASDENSAIDVVLPIASPTVLGGVKVDGTSITVDSEGIIKNSYTISLVDVQNQPNAKVLRLKNNDLSDQDIQISVSSGISLSRVNNLLSFIGTTYSLSSQTSDGNSVKLRLADSNSVNNDVTFFGADGIEIEITDTNSITFRSTVSGGETVDSDDIKDAAALLFVNGTHSGISYTYDSSNKVINSIASAGGGSGDTILYDFIGSNSTSNNAILSLVPSSGITDQIEIAGGGGTTVSWDTDNKKITVASTAPVNADWNATSGLSEILNKPTIPPAYALPAASASILGGIKVGANLSINADGVLSANPGSYTLPIASSSTLGGIKIGSGLTIDGNGVLNATGGSTVPTIQDLTGTTSSLAPNQTKELNIIGYKAYSLFKITTNAESWVRVYVSDAARDADVTRSEGEDPTPGSGVIAEVRTTGAESILVSPGIMGFNNDDPRTDTIYLSVTNRSLQNTTITVTLTALQIGE